MIDIHLLRDNPQRVRELVGRKKFHVDFDAIFEIDNERREAVSAAERARAEQKAINQEMAALDKQSPEFRAKVAEMKERSAAVKTLEARAKELDDKWRELILTIPNIPDESVPQGRSDADNKVVAEWGNRDTVSQCAVPHYDIPWFSELIDFERGAKVTGAGFPFFFGDMARLQRALIQFCLDEARSAGYTEVMPPLLVNAESATATGQLPDKEGQMYHAQADDLYLIPTAEVPVTNFFRDETVDEDDLPLRYCAYTPCFRREAGSWGKDVRGLNRLHQFDKVELVKWVHPDRSFDELESLRSDAESLLRKLELPYRVLLICSGDIGFPHAKQYDLEVWAGGQKRWLEVSSCSNFTDFQARRAGIRFRPKGGGKSEVVHTLNGSGLGLPRVLAALLENNLQADGSIAVPKVLQERFGSATLQGPPRKS